MHDGACGFDHVTFSTCLAGSSSCSDCNSRDCLRCASLIAVFVDDSLATLLTTFAAMVVQQSNFVV